MGEGVRRRAGGGFLEGVMLQCGARGAVRLGKEVSVHIPGFSLPEKREGNECEGKGGER